MFNFTFPFEIIAQMTQLAKFENELETMRKFYSTPWFKEIVEKAIEAFFEENLEDRCDVDALTKQSNRLREEGNRLFNAKLGQRDSLGACRLYTRAIFAAPADTRSLALAHANRGIALQEFGYFRQAYDDAVCALALGYPEHLRHKIVVRQATCSLELGDLSQAERHLNELDALDLNEFYTQQVQVQVRQRLEDLQQQHQLKQQPKEQETGAENNDNEKEDVQTGKIKIVQSPGPAGRFMVATKPIGKNETIFSDYAFSFVPMNGAMPCQQCATMELIPFPCKRCHGRVVYCSLKCREDHAKIHSFECPGYRRNLFDNDKFSGAVHLALRTLLEGLPQVIPLLRGKRNAQSLWTALVGKDNVSIVSKNSVAYAQTLRLMHHFDTIDADEFLSMVETVNVAIYYLKKYTNFFNLSEGSAASRHDWELVTAAILLRHLGQFSHGGNQFGAILPLDFKHAQPFNFMLLRSDFWAGPLRFQRGRLHKIGNNFSFAMANFPNLELCNHDCEPMFHSRFSGRKMFAVSLGDVRTDTEITHCYMDYHHFKQEFRRGTLRSNFHFECECSKCMSANPDAYYKSLHRYRCEIPKCRQVFVPHLPQIESLKWWEMDHDDIIPQIKCTVCGVKQRFEWFEKFKLHIRNVNNCVSRMQLYRNFEEMDKCLIDHHELKWQLAFDIVLHCLAAHDAGYTILTDADFNNLVRILKFCLSYLAAQCGMLSRHYVCKMTFLWDFIALGKYKCTRDEMAPMLSAIEIASDEMKTIFMNYYTDYIEPLLLP